MASLITVTYAFVNKTKVWEKGDTTWGKVECNEMIQSKNNDRKKYINYEFLTSNPYLLSRIRDIETTMGNGESVLIAFAGNISELVAGYEKDGEFKQYPKITLFVNHIQILSSKDISNRVANSSQASNATKYKKQETFVSNVDDLDDSVPF